jgi:drug/metabolite transporter (DMT)-like permease
VIAFNALVTLPLAIRDSRRHTGPKRAVWTLLLPAITDAFTILLFFRAMSSGPLAIAVLTHCSAPLLVAVISPLVTDERARPQTFLAVFGAMLGLVMLLEPWRELAPGALSCALFGGASALFYAANVLVQKRMGASWTAAELFSYHSFPAALILALAVPAHGFAIRLDQVALLSIGGVFPGVLAGLAFLRGLEAIPASHAALMALLEPTVAVFLGVVVWREPLHPVAALGAAVVLIALASAVFERPTRSSEAP